MFCLKMLSQNSSKIKCTYVNENQNTKDRNITNKTKGIIVLVYPVNSPKINDTK